MNEFIYAQELLQDFFKKLHKHEELNINYSAEQSFFLRFSQSKVRQITSLEQGILSLQFVENSRTLNFRIPFSGDSNQDMERLDWSLKNCREKIKYLPEDPFIVPLENRGKLEEIYEGKLPEVKSLAEELLATTQPLDFVGCLSMGKIIRGNMNSTGQTNFFCTENYNIDYSIYNDNQKAVKGLYAGKIWNLEEFRKSIHEAQGDLETLKIKPVKLAKGRYNVYLAPDAVGEIIDIFSWGAVSYASLMKGSSPLMNLYKGEKTLSKKFCLLEDFSLGLSPRFNDRGELSPEMFPIIENGEIRNFLISSRTAKEYGVKSNGASSSEVLRSAVVKAGVLEKERILEELKCGIYISNLHYLNWSDIQSGRFTGMTRFACFYVENGKIIAPIEDLRFDESLYDIFGPNLLEVTTFRQLMPNVASYGMRSLGGKLVPGILVKDFNFTL